MKEKKMHKIHCEEATMEISQLKYFCALANTRHFTRTARDISISQSALSRSITKLEQELGTPLFKRGSREVLLTSAGERFLVHAERALRELETARQEIADDRDPERGVISLSFMHSLGIHILPQLLSEFRQLYPRIQFTLNQDNSSVQAQNLLAGKSDICLCSIMANMDQLAWVCLYTEELFAALPKDHPFAQRSSIELRELANEPFITLKPNYSLRILADQFFAISGISPDILFEGDDINTTAALVSARLGVSLLPRTAVGERADLVFLPISFPVCKREIGLAWSTTRPLTTAAQLFQRFVINRFVIKKGSQ